MMQPLKFPYLRRREARAVQLELRQRIIFGFVLGWLLTLVGAFKYYLVMGSIGWLWIAAMWLGALILLLTLTAPAALAPIESLFRRGGHLIGGAVFSAVLSAVYLLFFWPVGALLRRRRGPHPFYYWSREASAEFEGWVKKELPVETSIRAGQRLPLLAQPFLLMTFLARRGQFLFLPALVLLLVLGLVLFFVQSSALAPFIYTLF